MNILYLSYPTEGFNNQNTFWLISKMDLFFISTAHIKSFLYKLEKTPTTILCCLTLCQFYVLCVIIMSILSSVCNLTTIVLYLFKVLWEMYSIIFWRFIICSNSLYIYKLRAIKANKMQNNNVWKINEISGLNKKKKKKIIFGVAEINSHHVKYQKYKVLKAPIRNIITKILHSKETKICYN